MLLNALCLKCWVLGGAGKYTVNFHGVESVVAKQTVADAFLHSNGSIHLRAFGTLNLTLWNDMLKEFEERHGQLTPADVIMINFGAW